MGTACRGVCRVGGPVSSDVVIGQGTKRHADRVRGILDHDGHAPVDRCGDVETVGDTHGNRLLGGRLDVGGFEPRLDIETVEHDDSGLPREPELVQGVQHQTEVLHGGDVHGGYQDGYIGDVERGEDVVGECGWGVHNDEVVHGLGNAK